MTNSRYVLVGYFITSYPTPAHGIIVKYSARFRRIIVKYTYTLFVYIGSEKLQWPIMYTYTYATNMY